MWTVSSAGMVVSVSDLAEQVVGDRGRGVAAAKNRLVGPAKAAPAAFEPVGLVRLEAERRLELALEQGDELLRLLVQPSLVDDPFRNQPLGVDFADRRVGLDRGVHQRLGEARLVALVVAKAAVAPHVDDDVATEGLAELDCQLAGEGDGFGIVAVDVEDRRLDRFRHVRRVGRRAAELRAGGEADLVVDDEVDRAAGAVAGQAGEAEAFGDDPLARERRVTVEQDRKDGLAMLVLAQRLQRARLAEHHGIDGLEV